MSLARQSFNRHACHFIEQALPRRPLPHRTWPLRHQTDQEGHQNHPLFWADSGFEEEKRRRDREQISVRTQRTLDHRRFGARERRPLHQPCLPPECGIRRQTAQAQGLHPRHQEDRAGRGDQLRLRHRLLQSLSEANRLQMRGLREEAQEKARRGAGGKAPPQGQGGAKGVERDREAQGEGGEGQRKSQGQTERPAQAQRSRERRHAERPFAERAWRGKQNIDRRFRYYSQVEADAGPGRARVGVVRRKSRGPNGCSVIARSAATKQSTLSLRIDGLLRGACHRARIRATRWLAMTLLYLTQAATTPPLLRRPIYCNSANTPVAMACATTTISPSRFGLTAPENNSAMLTSVQAALPATTNSTSARGTDRRVPSQPTSAA